MMGDYNLLTSSPYKLGGTDGRDIGVDAAALAAATRSRATVADTQSPSLAFTSPSGNAGLSRPPAAVSNGETEPSASYLSDRTWTYGISGWGPIERDKSNGDLAGGDGGPMKLNGVSYSKGLGVHADSYVRFALGGACSTFTSDIGVDDETGPNGSVIFRVFADGVNLYDSGVMTGSSATRTISVDIRSRSELRLVVTNAGDGYSWDHGNWAGARVTCQ